MALPGYGDCAVIAEAAAAVTLALMSIEDVRTREVSEHIFLAGLASVTVLKLLEAFFLGEPVVQGLLPVNIYLLLDATVLGLAAAMAYMKIYGWGDVAALLLVAAASPGAPHSNGVLPAAMTTVIYSGLITAAYPLANFVSNIGMRRAAEKLPPRVRLLYMFMARPVRAKELVEKPGWRYPLNLCGRYRFSFNIYLDPEDVARIVKEAIQKGCISSEDYLWVTRGLPGIVFIAAGYIASLILGDPLEWLLKR